MEFAKDEIFGIEYNKSDNILKFKKKRWTSKLFKENNFIKLVVLFTIIFAFVNIILVYNFFSILMKM